MTEKHWEEPLGNGVATYSNSSGKIEMVGYVQHNTGQIVLGSINDLNIHPAYAFKKARQVAETILRDDNATDNERALADCIIALHRNMGRSYDR